MDIVNLRPHAKRITDLSPIAWDLGYIKNNIGNFSLLPLPNNHWLCSFRVFAYWISRFGEYLWNKDMMIQNPDQILLLELDENFGLIRRFQNISNTYYLQRKNPEQLPFIEDTRLHVWDGKIYAISTLCEQDNYNWVNSGLEVQRIDIDLENGTFSATHLWNTIENSIRGIEKNWLPIPTTPFTYLTQTNPNGTMLYDISRNRTMWMGELKNDRYRGNTPLLSVDGKDNKYLAIVHKVLPPNGLDRQVKTYLNFLVEYDECFIPTRFSKPFKLTNVPIEFVTDLKIHDNTIQIGVTSNDDTPEIHTYDFECLLQMVIRNEQ